MQTPEPQNENDDEYQRSFAAFKERFAKARKFKEEITPLQAQAIDTEAKTD